MSLMDTRSEALSQELADDPEPAPVLINKVPRWRKVAEPISYDPNDYQIDHIPTYELTRIVDSSQGDARLFASFLILHRFLDKLRFGGLGPHEDPVKLYDCYLDDIDRRLGELSLGETKVSELTQDLQLVA